MARARVEQAVAVEVSTWQGLMEAREAMLVHGSAWSIHKARAMTRTHRDAQAAVVLARSRLGDVEGRLADHCQPRLSELAAVRWPA